jgi:Ca2+:H+ antiporter
MSLGVGVMLAMTVLIVWISEILVATVEHASQALGLTNLFVSIVVVAPLLVLLSLVIAPAPLSSAFTPVEVFLVLMATFVASILLVDGQ